MALTWMEVKILSICFKEEGERAREETSESFNVRLGHGLHVQKREPKNSILTIKPKEGNGEMSERRYAYDMVVSNTRTSLYKKGR